MKLTLIITTYNWPVALLLVLKSVLNQTVRPYEIVVADDGSRAKTMDLISNFKSESNLNIIHSWQEDIGFRAARSRNNAIIKSSGDYIILIDGDVILHPNFIKDHLSNAESGYFVQGSRVLLSEVQTKKIIKAKKENFSVILDELPNRKNGIHSNLLSKIFSSKKNTLHGIKSCNMGFFREDCYIINGFNNDFEGWGREDSEFAVRLLNSGIKRKNVRFNAVQFHLWHQENSRKSLESNDALLAESINNNLKWCLNGINSKKNES
jgi:glycosyltransferase involved in cell wall biosynthesis